MAFQKGLSGNPNGKPKGTRHRVTVAAEALMEGEAEAITRKVIELAKEGDGPALRPVSYTHLTLPTNREV